MWLPWLVLRPMDRKVAGSSLVGVGTFLTWMFLSLSLMSSGEDKKILLIAQRRRDLGWGRGWWGGTEAWNSEKEAIEEVLWDHALLVTAGMKKDVPVLDTLWRCHHRTVLGVSLRIGCMGVLVRVGAGWRGLIDEGNEIELIWLWNTQPVIFLCIKKYFL